MMIVRLIKLENQSIYYNVHKVEIDFPGSGSWHKTKRAYWMYRLNTRAKNLVFLGCLIRKKVSFIHFYSITYSFIEMGCYPFQLARSEFFVKFSHWTSYLLFLSRTDPAIIAILNSLQVGEVTQQNRIIFVIASDLPVIQCPNKSIWNINYCCWRQEKLYYRGPSNIQLESTYVTQQLFTQTLNFYVFRARVRV